MLQKMFPQNGSTVPEIRFAGFTEDWEQRKLGEICERVTRKNKNNESDLPLTIASQFGLIDQRDFFNKVVAAKDMSNYYLLKKGEFAYNKSYSNGFDYGSIKRLNAYDQGCLSTLYICFGITSDEVESDYLECFFDTLKWYGDVSMICAEGARNHGLLNVDMKGFFDEVTIDLPNSLEEQKKISAYLNALDNLVTLHQCKPKEKGQSRINAWEQRKLSELIIEYKEIVDSECTLPILTSSKTEGVVLQEEHFGRKQLHDITGYNILPRNYCTYRNRSDGVDFTFNINKCCDKGIISKFYPVFYGNNSNIFFISLVLNYSDEVVKEIAYTCTGTGQKVLSFLDLQKMKVRVPSEEEQNKIAAYFDTLDTLITLHQRKCDELQSIKKYMLQNMFT